MKNLFNFSLRAKLSSAMTSKKLLDSGAGFFIDEEDLIIEKEKSKKLVELPRKFII